MSRRVVERSLAAATVLMLVAAASVFTVARLTADTDPIPAAVRDEIGLPAPLTLITPIPEPDASRAVGLDQVRDVLVTAPGVLDALAAADSGDAQAVVDLVAVETVACMDLGSWGVGVPVSCTDHEAVVPMAEDIKRGQLTETAYEWLGAIFSAGATLDLVVRDDRTPDGEDGIYYLGFGTPQPIDANANDPEHPHMVGGLGIVVRGRSDHPIVAIAYLAPEYSPRSPGPTSTVWVESLLPEHRVLVAPIDLEGRPSFNDTIRLPKGYPGYPEGYPPEKN